MPAQDTRLLLRFGNALSRRPHEAVLTDRHPLPGAPSFALPGLPGDHAPGCECCAPRSAAAVALAGLFRARALGGAFGAVLADVSPANEAAIRAALDGDVLVAARFRLQTAG